MQSENRFFDDLGKIINGAAGTIAGMGREFESNAKEKAREWMAGMDFVSREEFEAVKAMAASAREEVEQLKARLAALESGQTRSITPKKAVKAAPETPPKTVRAAKKS